MADSLFEANLNRLAVLYLLVQCMNTKFLTNMYFTTFVRLAYLLFLICWPLPAGAQQESRPDQPSSAKSLTYGFVSPNTREGLKLEDAIRNLNSQEEEKLIRQARGMACVARSKVGTLKAVGSWSDGAEHSVLLSLKTDEPTVRYVVSLLGRKSEQKAVLYFHSDAAGTATMYTLQSQRTASMRRLARLLDRAGVAFRTLVPQRHEVVVYVIDLKRELHSKIIAAARNLKARVISRHGTAEFIGDDSSREKAKTIFDEEIKNYESKNAALVTRCRNQMAP